MDYQNPVTKKFLDAIKQGQSQAVKDILEQQNISLKEKNCGLLEAARNGNLALVKLLISQGAQINESCSLEYAVEKEHEHVVKFLLSQEGVEVDYPDNDKGWSALMFTAWNGNVNIAQLLLDHGADIDHENIFEQTALILAAERCPCGGSRYRSVPADCSHQGVIKILLQAHFALNKQDQYGQTALHYAVGNACTQTVKLLLDAGTDPDIKNHKEQTAIEKTKNALRFVAQEQEKLNKIHTLLEHYNESIKKT
ncbi:MAG: ankyrin repeat domain-containing protein [Candidatus Babeliales bacterium]